MSLYQAVIRQVHERYATLELQVAGEPLEREFHFGQIDRAGLGKKEFKKLQRYGPRVGEKALAIVNEHYRVTRVFFR